MILLIEQAKVVVANQINRTLDEEKSRLSSNNQETVNLGAVRLDDLSHFVNAVRMSSDLYSINSARMLEEFNAGITNGSPRIKAFIDDGIYELITTFGLESMESFSISMAEAMLVVNHESSLEQKIGYKALLTNNPELVYYILVKQCDLNLVNQAIPKLSDYT